MAVEFRLPELGENIDSGDIVKWLVKPGDVVKKDQPLLELETGKAVVEVPSSVSGKVIELLAQEGDKVNVGDAVLTVEGEASGEEKAAAPLETAEKAPAKGKEKPKKSAEREAESVPAPAKMDRVQPAPQPTEEKVAARATQSQPQVEERGNGAVPAAPIVKRIAREMGIDLSHIRGSGPDGRITIEDVQSFAARRGGAAPAGAGLPLPDFSKWGGVEAKAMSNVRRITAQHLTHAWTTIPQVTQFDKADITRLEDLRKRYAPRVEEAGGKLTMTAILVKVLAAALEKFPQFSASVDSQKNEIIYKHYSHVGVAVDTEFGLIVPVIRDANKKNVREIAVELADLSDRARKRKLEIEEMEGGSISISNLGGIGGTAFSPIVNWPEVAILGVSRSAMEQVWMFNRFEARLMLPLSLSYDHRVIDGADAARFLRFVCESLEEPFLLALEG